MNNELNFEGAFEESSFEGFDVASEFVPDPVVPDGTFKGLIVGVEKQVSLGAVKINVQLEGNDGIMCSDGATPIDGKQIAYTLWLPKKGDELVKSKFSNLTVRQEAIRGIKKFADNMGVKIETVADVEDAITNNKWLSTPVLVKVKSKPYNGKIYNRVTGMFSHNAPKVS